MIRRLYNDDISAISDKYYSMSLKVDHGIERKKDHGPIEGTGGGERTMKSSSHYRRIHRSRVDPCVLAPQVMSSRIVL